MDLLNVILTKMFQVDRNCLVKKCHHNDDIVWSICQNVTKITRTKKKLV